MLLRINDLEELALFLDFMTHTSEDAINHVKNMLTRRVGFFFFKVNNIKHASNIFEECFHLNYFKTDQDSAANSGASQLLASLLRVESPDWQSFVIFQLKKDQGTLLSVFCVVKDN